MNSYNIQELLKVKSSEPCFFVNFYNLGRAVLDDNRNGDSPYIKCTKGINCWRIIDDNLEKINEVGILFDTETYIIQWIFELLVDSNVKKEESLFYYWKGNDACKGFSPLPVEIENQDTIVERIRQWSEPALFFHVFPKPLVVFSGKRENFNRDTRRLLIVRGELESEIHLFEVPRSKENLRSRAAFLLVDPSTTTIFYWYGASIATDHQKLISRKVKQIDFGNYWSNFKKVEICEGQDDLFFDALESGKGDYVAFRNGTEFSPRLFYLNSITGNFLATEVVYPLRSNEHVAPFPFLQSHLYTAIQPAFFLLDNHNEIWLWEGWLTPETNLELYNSELDLAKETAVNYAKEKEKLVGFSTPIKHVLAGLEPIEFINIFPYWNKQDDIADTQLEGGRSTGVKVLKK